MEVTHVRQFYLFTLFRSELSTQKNFRPQVSFHEFYFSDINSAKVRSFYCLRRCEMEREVHT